MYDRPRKAVFDFIKYRLMGLSTSAGINMFLYQVFTEKGFPFTPTSDAKKIRARWDVQASQSSKGKKYLNAKSALKGL
jgi:antitoxin component of RelBE/YafQ-DinJ toxin-antitoxin module